MAFAERLSRQFADSRQPDSANAEKCALFMLLLYSATSRIERGMTS